MLRPNRLWASRLRSLPLIAFLVAASYSHPVPAQYSAAITANPPASALYGGYTAEILRRGGYNFGRSNIGRTYSSPSYRSYALPSTWPGGFGWGQPVYPDPWFGGYGPDAGLYGYSAPYYWDGGGELFGPYVAPPLILPGEALYGPQAVRRFMGLDPPQRPIVNNILVAPPDGAALPANGDRLDEPAPDPRAAKKPRFSNAAARDRARKAVAAGDALFADRRASPANERYRAAAVAAPDLAEPLVRQAIALAILKRYPNSARAFRRAFDIQPNWLDNQFQLASLYAGDQRTHDEDLEKLAAAADRDPGDADLQFVAGAIFFLDQQPQIAQKYLEQARAAGGESGAIYADHFVRAIGEALRPKPANAQPGELDI